MIITPGQSYRYHISSVLQTFLIVPNELPLFTDSTFHTRSGTVKDGEVVVVMAVEEIVEELDYEERDLAVKLVTQEGQVGWRSVLFHLLNDTLIPL